MSVWVKGYTRTTKTGKVIKVSGHSRGGGNSPIKGIKRDAFHSGEYVPKKSSFIQKVSFKSTDINKKVGSMNVHIGGKAYTYANVPHSKYEELIKAASTGSYFTKNIKGKYG